MKKQSPLKRQGMIAQSLGFNNLVVNRPFDYKAVADDIDDSINLARERRRQDELDRRRRFSYGQLQAKTASSLMLDSDSGYNAIDSYASKATRELADRGSALVTQLENGVISAAEFGNLYSTLQNQVGQIKPLLESLQTKATEYATEIAQGNRSMANDEDHESFMEALVEGRGELTVDDKGVVVFKGKTKDGKEFSIPANQIANMPQNIARVNGFSQLTKPITNALNELKETDEIDPITKKPTGKIINASVAPFLSDSQFRTAIRGGFDDFLAQNSMNGLKSLAMDHQVAGFSPITYDEMDQMANSGSFIPSENDFTDWEIANIPGIVEEMAGETFANQLEFEMEKRWIKTAMDQTFYNQQQNWTQRNYELEKEKILSRERIAQLQANQARSVTERDRVVNLRFINQLPAPTPDNLDAWNLNAPGTIRIGKEGKDNKYYLYDPKTGKKYMEVPSNIMSNPNELAKVLAIQLYGVPVGMTSFNYAPIKKAGPIKKVREFFNI
tara:strand:- start:7459 stop:8961 length:1503 start_codon:yes stop_codon:yes gene_type:complete